MNVMHSILDTDQEIIENSEVDAVLYSVVQRFVDDNNLQQRAIGSKLFFWLDVDCGGGHKMSHYFEVTIKENLVYRVVSAIKMRFGKELDELMTNKCTLKLEKG